MLSEQKIPLDKILLDPNNYRFQELGDYAPVPTKKYTSTAVQKRALDALKRFGLSELKNSIQQNGFIEVDRIVVEPTDDGYFLTVEGNRRIAALKQIKADIDNDLLDDDNLKSVVHNVPCVVTDGASGELFRLTLMGIRHVGGVSEWGGYQRAKLVADLRDRMKLDPSDVAAKTGLSIQEVNRRYRAYKALEQMGSDEEFEDFATPSLYPIFHEAISQPVVREWLGWDPDNSKFTNDADLEFFYQLVTPTDQDAGEQLEPKIKTYSDVRSLKQVLMNDEAKSILYDDDQSYMNAVLAAKRKEMSGKWRKEASEASNSLRNIGALDLADFTDKDLKILENLRDSAHALITQYEKISG